MMSYALRQCLTAWEFALHRVAVDIVADVRDDLCRCHELTRAAHRVLSLIFGGDRGLRSVDGICGGVDHSWIVTKTGSVLDVYRPGFHPQVLLIDRRMTHDYLERTLRLDIDHDAVDRLVTQMVARPDARWGESADSPGREETGTSPVRSGRP